MGKDARHVATVTFLVAVVQRSDDSGIWYRNGDKTIVNKNLKKDMEKRKARIDTDVMERFVPSCSRCVNAVGNGYGDYWCRNYIFGSYYMYISSGMMKKDCKHYKRKV